MRYLGPKQAAHHLGVSVRTLEDWRVCEPLKGPVFYKIEGRVYYKEEDLDIFLDSSRVDPQEQPRLPFAILIDLERKRRAVRDSARKNCGASDLSQLPIFAMKAG
jgi:hypothetical protein